ncbi:MAG: right-handed parallel beta-helix repeat-containing protein [Aphanothece sp. CMT-3BRIN-NPC111]|nr:right-handed parallel beta-helix repeat-containing protein [Aphanothece sp. CMT-3BRIN-NPC111]
MRKSTRLTYITLLLVGTLTSTAVAQTVEPETKSLSEVNLPPRTLSEADFLSQTPNLEAAPTPDTVTPNPVLTQNTDLVRLLRVTPRIGAEFTTGPGVGYESSFGSIEGFVPLLQTPGQNLTYFQGRLLISTDDAQLGGNALVGHRIYNPTNNRILGGYLAYDIRDTGNSTFNQLGAGVESLGESFDVLANAYIPIGDTRQTVGETTFNSVSFSNPTFQTNFLALMREQQQQINRRLEAALTGFDAEAGVRIARLGRQGNLRGYGGLYYYDGPGISSFVGGRARLEARLTDTFRLGLLLQGDDHFGTNLVFSVGASFPGSGYRGINKQEQVLARLGESVARQENIAVDERFESELVTQRDTVLATNPNTGQALRFRHVNLGRGTGNGTFENPTGTVAQALASAQSNDIVYVQRGNNPGIPAFTIPNGVSVLSAGSVQRIDTLQISNLQLPGSGSGARPRVTGTVTLGNNNTLSGFEINGARGPGILGTNINNTTIQDNIISNSTIDPTNTSNLGNGIFLTNATGNIDITNNTIRNNSENAILINNNAGQVDMTIANNALADNVNGIRVNLLGTAPATAQITNNSVTNGGNGVDFNVGENAKLNNLAISNNSIEGSNQGINFRAFDNAQSTVNVSNNTLRNITGDGVNFGLNQNSRTQLNVSGNSITNTNDDGIDTELFDNAVVTATISNNQVSNSGDIGIEVDADNNSQLRLVIKSNTVTGSANQGISIFSGAAGGSAKIFASVRLNRLTGNNVSGLANGGFDAQTFDTSRMCLQLDNNTSDRFTLVNNSGTFQVENTLSTNTGTVNRTGTTNVPQGSCGY